MPLDNARECLLELMAWLQAERESAHGLRYHFPMEIRPVAADDIWLSPGSGKPVVWFGMVQYRPVRRLPEN